MISNLDIEKYHEINMDQVFVALADRNIRVNKCTCPCNCNSDDVVIVKRETNADANATVMNLVPNPGTRITNSEIISKEKTQPHKTSSTPRNFDRINKLQREQVRRKFNRRHPGGASSPMTAS